MITKNQYIPMYTSRTRKRAPLEREPPSVIHQKNSDILKVEKLIFSKDERSYLKSSRAKTINCVRLFYLWKGFFSSLQNNSFCKWQSNNLQFPLCFLGITVVYFHQNLGGLLAAWTFLGLSYYKNPQLSKRKYLNTKITYIQICTSLSPC